MATLDVPDLLTLEQLCEEVETLRRRHRAIGKSEPIQPRTVRFYIERGLLPPVRSGPGKKYPVATAWKILFTWFLQDRHSLSLTEIRRALQEVPVDTMRRVITGDEPLEILRRPDTGAVQRHRDAGYQVVDFSRPAAGPAADADSEAESPMPATAEPLPREPMDDSPRRLGELSDVAKARAVATGVEKATGDAFEAVVEAVRYRATFRHAGFLRPAECVFTLTSAADPEFASLQRVAERDLEAAIATVLGEAVGEAYRVAVVEKHYRRGGLRDEGMRIVLQVARA
jgi:DNA-binding transcriptional MerR regulator